LRYQGGKSRIASQIAEIIQRERERESNVLVSLFCGSCAVESKLSSNFDKLICNDNNLYLIALLQGVQNGYVLPEKISKEQYHQIKNNKDIDKTLTGFVGFGCSFGGKWFGGYASDSTGTNYALQSKKSLLKDLIPMLNKTEFICMDYKNVVIPKGAIVYCDPPYKDTTGYGNKFNHETFWDYMRTLSKTHKVFISEQTAPDDFKCIWEKPLTRTLDRNKSNQFKSTEKLFIFNP